MLATGIGSLVLAGLVIAAESSESFAMSLAYDLEVGPLSGKTLWAAFAFFVSWGGLTVALRGRPFDTAKATVICAVLLGLGYLATFAPRFRAFAPDG
jgi:hypothetical protein